MTWHIFAGGVLNGSDFICIESDDRVICADRGIVHAQKLKIVPNLIIGDFDFYKSQLPENVEILRSVPEKDDTDTMLAVKTAISRGAKKIRIYGALGGRFDHTFANIQTLKFASENGCWAEIADEGNRIMLREKGVHQFRKMDGWYFSIFSYSEELNIKSLRGVKYPLENYLMKNSFPIGVSNEFEADSAELSIDSGTSLIIFSRE